MWMIRLLARQQEHNADNADKHRFNQEAKLSKRKLA